MLSRLPIAALVFSASLPLLVCAPRQPARGATFYCDPAKGDPGGDGSAERPWRRVEEVIAAGCIQLVGKDGKPSNPEAPVKPGDTVLLRSGWHGAIRIRGGINDRPITIAAEPGSSPQVGFVEISEGSRWLVKGLTVSTSLAPAPLDPSAQDRLPHSLVMLGEGGGDDSADLVVEDCFIYSTLDTSSWSGKDWVEKARSGIWLGRHGKGHIARNNYVLNVRFGIDLCAPECLCEGNVVANFSGDGIRVTRDGQVVQYNVIRNNLVSDKDGDGNHDDGIQAFLFNVGTGTLRDATIRGNIIIARDAEAPPFPNPLQGIGFFDGPLVNFTVAENVVCVNHYHGVSLYDAQGCSILDNACLSRWGGKARPWVMLGQKKKEARGNIVRDNLAHSFNFAADPEVKASGNREVSEGEFDQRLAALSALIDGKFGARHPVAGRTRLAGAASSGPAPKEPAGTRDASYAVVVSRATSQVSGWKRVVEDLARRHSGRVIVHGGDIREALGPLREAFPRYACFVATPGEATREFVAAVHRLTRKLDDDPYTDVLWGIVTGFDATTALATLADEKPLVIRSVVSGTEIALEACEEGVWYSELQKGRRVRKERGGKPIEEKAPDDTTQDFVDLLNGGRADLLVTSGHATERDWQIGYSYRNGRLESRAGGELCGVDTQGKVHPIQSRHPMVWLPVGNCLVGHVDGPQCMALSFQRWAGVRQMIGYTVPTWYGYAGWGCLDYFLEQPGRYTLAEAFFANLQALIHRLDIYFPEVAREEPEAGKVTTRRVAPGDAARKAGLGPQDAAGLLHDRDVLAFYGDPAWEARMAEGPKAWTQELREKDGVWTFEIRPAQGERTFEPVSRNGSQRGGRPIVELFPRRLEKVEILEGKDLSSCIADDFILVPNPGRCEPGRTYRVTFRAVPAVRPASASK